MIKEKSDRIIQFQSDQGPGGAVPPMPSLQRTSTSPPPVLANGGTMNGELAAGAGGLHQQTVGVHPPPVQDRSLWVEVLRPTDRLQQLGKYLVGLIEDALLS